MKEKEFKRLADAYGADIARWPERFRAVASAVEREPWAVSILTKAGQVDDLFASQTDSVAADRVARAIAAVNGRVARASTVSSWRQRLLYLLAPVSGMAAASLFGIWLGLGGMQVFAAPETGLANLLALAMSFDDPSFLLQGG